MNRRQGFPLYDITIWVEDLGDKQYRVWHSHNDGPQRHYNERVTRDPVAAVQEDRAQILRIYARHAQGTTPELMRKQRVETYSAWAQLIVIVLPFVVTLMCFAFYGPTTTAVVVLVALCLKGLA